MLDDLTGRTFGSLTVLRRGSNGAGRKTRWICRCVCGAKTLTHGNDLRSGHSVSCGGCSRIVNLTGQRFGRLTAVKRGPDNRQGQIQWICRCRCGTKQLIVRASHLRTGNTRSCGCLQPEVMRRTSKKHGMSASREYDIWVAMKGRCQNPNAHAYQHYGGRGIKVASEFQTFEGFHRYMGTAPPGFGIDRIDNNGDYRPGNVRWADQKTQMRNTRVNHRYEFDGRSLTLIEWSEVTGVSLGALRGRLRLGWRLREALTRSKWERQSLK